jgi:uncharacterized membrane protein YozB (DUF420 family)
MKILQQRIEQHREWMLRSFSLSLFFVSFSLWVPFFAQFGGVLDPAYFVAVTLSWGLNLSVAEIWIRCTRAESKQARTSCYSNHNKRHWLGS